MRKRIFFLGCAIACLGLIVPMLAQEGHPLTGTWGGDWGPSATQRNHLTFVLNWDGKSITGTINPGVDSMPIKNASLNPEGWVVHFEADAKDKAGAALTYVVDGKIENIHLPKRTITGTWKNQKENGAFNVERQ